VAYSNPVDTPLEVNVKYHCDDGDLLPDPLLYRQLVGSLNYLTITDPEPIEPRRSGRTSRAPDRFSPDRYDSKHTSLTASLSGIKPLFVTR
jgi:hypothetical protein